MPEADVTGISLMTMRRVTAAALVLGGFLLADMPRAHAQSQPDTENGRYTLSPSPEGFLRLDTRSGAVSTCTNKRGWACRLVPDERTALDAEIGRLQDENRQLKEQLAKRDAEGGNVAIGKTDAPVASDESKVAEPKVADSKPAESKAVESGPHESRPEESKPPEVASAEPKLDPQKQAEAKPAPLPKIELQLPPEHAKLMALLDRVWGRLVEMAAQVQKRFSEKI